MCSHVYLTIIYYSFCICCICICISVFLCLSFVAPIYHYFVLSCEYPALDSLAKFSALLIIVEVSFVDRFLFDLLDSVEVVRLWQRGLTDVKYHQISIFLLHLCVVYPCSSYFLFYFLPRFTPSLVWRGSVYCRILEICNRICSS